MNKALKQSLTGAVKTLLYGSGMVGLARRVGVQGNQLPMVRYHSISESPDYCPRSISVPAGLFEREIAYLAANYVVLKHEQAVECLLMGRPFPSRAVVISFDDGYKDNVTTALPILTRYGVSAIFYVAAGPVLERERFWVGWLQRAIFGAPRPLVVAEAFEIPLESVSSPRGVDRQALVDAVSRRINTGSRAVRHNALRLVEEALAGTSTIPDGVEFMMNVDDLLQLSRARIDAIPGRDLHDAEFFCAAHQIDIRFVWRDLHIRAEFGQFGRERVIGFAPAGFLTCEVRVDGRDLAAFGRCRCVVVGLNHVRDQHGVAVAEPVLGLEPGHDLAGLLIRPQVRV